MSDSGEPKTSVQESKSREGEMTKNLMKRILDADEDEGSKNESFRLENLKKKVAKHTSRKLETDFEPTEEEDDALPLDCPICKKPFLDPVVTKCHHYFCEKCALKHHTENNDCFVCNEPTLGIFSTAVEVKKRIDEEREKARGHCARNYSISGEIQESFSGSTTPIHSQDTVQESSEQAENEPVEVVPKALVFPESNPGSLLKTMLVSEQAREGESCKRCNCKKSKCLKLYCECFAAGVYCIEPCSCIDCFNKPIHEDTVLATRKQIEFRNPRAFAPKVMKAGDDASETPASARHKRGCNCKKSNCLMKYCECYQAGVGCSINCICQGCKNEFGRKEAMVKEVSVSEMMEKASAMVDDAKGVAEKAEKMVAKIETMVEKVAAMATKAGETAAKAAEMVQEAEATMETAKANMAEAFAVLNTVVWDV